MMKNIFVPTVILAETIIGAGLFSLPYIFYKSGIVLGILYLIFFAIVFSIIHLMYGDIIIRTKNDFHFSGYAKKYLGNFGFYTSIAAVTCGMILTLTTYLALSKDFFLILFPTIPVQIPIIFFWLLASFAIFWKIKKLAIYETIFSIGVTLIIFLIFFFGFKNFSFFSTPIFPKELSLFFLPYGAVLFSLSGRSAIPALVGYFKKEKLTFKKLKLPIFLGTIIPAFLYLIFSVGALGLTKNISNDSVFEIIKQLPFIVALFFGILGILSMWDTYIVIGRDTEKSLETDLNWTKIISAGTIVGIPISLYFLGFNNFIELISLTGGIFGGIEGVLVVLMWKKSLKINETGESIQIKFPLIILISLIIIFITGAIYSLFF